MFETVEGVFRNGKIELFEIPENLHEARVYVTFLPAKNQVDLREHGIDEQQAADEVKRLSQKVAALEKELVMSREKCDQCREFVTQWMLGLRSQKELVQWAMDDGLTNFLPLKDFIGELEAMVRKAG